MKITQEDRLYILDRVKDIRDVLSEDIYEDYEPFDSIDEILSKCIEIEEELEVKETNEVFWGTMDMLNKLTIR